MIRIRSCQSMLVPSTLISFRKYSVALLLGLAVIPAWGRFDVLPRTDSEFVIDGRLSEAAWEGAMRIDLEVETNPGENLDAPVTTRAYLIEDGENLYVAFEADDPEPARIRAYLRDRDAAWGDDHVGIILDTYNDERRSFEFFVNPLGVQMDKIHNDTGGGGGPNAGDSWDAIWDSAGRINDDGYTVEMRIPLSQLRFPDVAGTKTWGYDLRRVYPRDRTYTFSSNARDRNRDCYLCQIGSLQGLDGSRPSRDIEIVPTLTASQNENTESPGIDPLVQHDPDVEAGLTVRWGITPDLTANVAINPDFSQIEADVAQLDVNNRFTLFFPEKRPFFLEGADYFSTPFDAVFTRTVSDPDVGAKLTGKKGRNTFGLFAARDAVTNLLFPGLYSSDAENFEQPNDAFVGRYSFGFENTSSLGGLVTLREGEGYHNYVAGVDGRWKLNDQHRVFFQHLESDTRYPDDIASDFEQPLGDFTGRATVAGYNYETRTWYGRLRHLELSEGFRADSGFMPQVGGTKRVAVLGRLFHGGEDDWWTRIRAHGQFEQMDEENGDLAERHLGLRFGIGGPLQSWFMVGHDNFKERDEGVLYDFSRAWVYTEFVPIGGLEVALEYGDGERIDYANGRLGKNRVIEPRVSWNATRNLMLRLNGVHSAMKTLDGVAVFDATLADLRATWQFNVRSFLRLTVQYQDIERNLDVYVDPEFATEKSVGRQLLYSYKLNPQTVFFVGYSDRYLDDDSLEDLTAEDRTIFMKVGYAWTP
jgi:hypothetical protein